MMPNRKNVLFISYDGLTDPLGQSQIIPYLKGLTAFGYTFTILTCDKPHHYERNKSAIISSLSGYPIKWVSLPYHKYPPVLSAMYDLQKLKKKAVSLHKAEPFHLVHTRVGTPALLGIWLKKHYGIKFLNDIRDFYADSHVDSGAWNLRNPLYRLLYIFFKKKEKEALLYNDGIVCLTYKAKTIMLDRIKNSSIPIKVIPCSVDTSLFNPTAISVRARAELKTRYQFAEEDMIISFLGSIKEWKILLFFKLILEYNPNAKFLLITPDNPDMIYSTCTAYSLDHGRVVVTSAGRNDIPLLLSLSSFSVFFLKESLSAKASSPTKHGEIMAMGIPVITNKAIGDIKIIVEKYHSGIVLESLEEESFRTVAKSLSSLKFDSAQIRSGALEYYDLNKAVETYGSIYQTILTAKSTSL